MTCALLHESPVLQCCVAVVHSAAARADVGMRHWPSVCALIRRLACRMFKDVFRGSLKFW